MHRRRVESRGVGFEGIPLSWRRLGEHGPWAVILPVGRMSGCNWSSLSRSKMVGRRWEEMQKIRCGVCAVVVYSCCTGGAAGLTLANPHHSDRD